MTFVRVGIDEIEIGQPLRWPLYDDKKQPLLARGAVVENAERKAALFGQGVFRKTVEDERPTGEGGERPAEDLRGLDEIRMDIGDTLQLQAQSETSQSRHYVKLIGYLKGKSVVVTTPTQDGKVLLMREGQAFVVRMFSGKSVYAFGATIFKVANVPYPHLHLTYPSQVRGLVVRRGARARVNLIAAVSGADGRSHAGTVVDLSIGGAMLVAKSPIGLKDDRIKVKFRVVVSDVEQYLILDAVLRTVHATAATEGEPSMVNHGLQFDSLPHAEQVVLSAYVYRVLFEESTEG
ncbi:MAG TPA: flagellar brake protein [Zoogloea sp.]|uniref:flagellar brake protein n=1 Tax=Zoogloea sp. TaxID=49181 RepID=UPI002BD2DE81|nr:flagellar brake protein [Zoogloea sp.]HMV64591.1 flagellar brake protein [Rhodocyclaceae bacterium]HMW52564.1 flagellar brake protein [Rhodocyclaceae bacterium]HMY50761.1 flagellar brake protein [Rhodocyclaceae bacterium]HND24993.1 flagellar brake protein [Rhodocyclaceae bacterium]HNE16048.1 flagellar brake protein [Rhodocyclaceae bacterium]